MIYFIQNGIDGPIKIGTADDPVARLRDMQVSNPVKLRLLATLEGSYKEEKEIHLEFGILRMRGEWFLPDKRLMKFIPGGAAKYKAIEMTYRINMPDPITACSMAGHDTKLPDRLRRTLRNHAILMDAGVEAESDNLNDYYYGVRLHRKTHSFFMVAELV